MKTFYNISFTDKQFTDILIMFAGHEITADQAIEILRIISEEGGNAADIAEKRGIRASDP